MKIKFVIEDATFSAYIDSGFCLRIPEGVEILGTGNFTRQKEIKGVFLPQSLVEIDEETFFGMSLLKSIVIPKNVKKIGSNICGNCFSLKSIKVEEGNGNYTSLDANCIIEKSTNNLIQGCAETVIPKCVDSIAYRSFWKNHELKTITITQNVKNIDKEAFYGTTLQNIHLPSGLINIGDYAFGECYSLTHIIYNGTITQWNAICKGYKWKDKVPSSCKVYCTDGDIDI